MFGISQAACEHAFEHFAERSCVGVQGEVVEEPAPVPGRCPEGNRYSVHARPCSDRCDADLDRHLTDVHDAEVVEEVAQ